MQTQPNELEILMAQLAQKTGASTPSKKDAPFVNYVVYSAKGTYLGNFSLPDNFTENSKAVVLNHLASIGLDLREPGSSKKEITAEDL
jgi:hypothetical protein